MRRRAHEMAVEKGLEAEVAVERPAREADLLRQKIGREAARAPRGDDPQSRVDDLRLALGELLRVHRASFPLGHRPKYM